MKLGATSVTAAVAGVVGAASSAHAFVVPAVRAPTRAVAPATSALTMGVPFELQGELDPSKKWEVELTLNGETKTVTVDEGTSILEAAELLWDNPPHSCRNGVCTTCSGKITAGDEGQDYKLAVHGLGEPQREAGFVMTCQTHPVGPGLKVLLNQYDVVYEDQYGKYEREGEDQKKNKLFGVF